MAAPPSGLPALHVLAADTPAGAATLRSIFDAHVVLTVANTMDDAMASLDRNIDAIVCGIHFHESRMFDLLRIAKAHPATRSVPFVCYRDLDTDLGTSVIEGLDIATKALGAAAFLDVYTLKRMNGVTSADTHLLCLVVELARSYQRLHRVPSA